MSQYLRRDSKAKVVLTIRDTIKSVSFKIFRSCSNIPKKSTNKSVLLENSHDYVKKYFDIINIMRKLEELEYLKQVMLTPNQLSIFNSLKHYIKEDKPQNIFENLGQNMEEFENRLKQQQQPSGQKIIDQNLFNIIQEHLKK